jgi:uncharacterized protein
VADIALQCEKDGSVAYLVIAEHPRGTLSVPQIVTLLKQRHIVHGINKAVLMEVAEGAHRGEKVVIASGTPMQEGTNGRLEWFIDLSKVGKPKELEDGSVDMRELQFDCNVRKGAPVVRIIPPVYGINGTTVFGIPVESPKVWSARISLGDGVEFDAERPDHVVASIDGAVYYDGKELNVRDRKNITGDIDYTTGNVTFNGDLHISGSVRSGFSVVAEGNITIGGDVEDAEIRCGGILLINGGAIGSGNGKITSTGAIRLHHVSHFTVESSDDIKVIEDVLHSMITADGTVSAKSIVGGEAKGFAVAAEALGSGSEVRTVVDIGSISQLSKERYSLLREFGILTKRRVELFDDLFQIVRDGMDENGKLGNGDLELLRNMKNTTVKSIRKAGEIQNRLEKIDGIEKQQQGSPLIRAGTIYPNTIIKNGREERVFTIMEKNVVIAGSKQDPETTE